MSRRIVFWGFGNNGKRALRKVFERTWLYTDNYLAIVDNSSDVYGNKPYGIPVVPPTELSKLSPEIVVICSIYEKDIRKQLDALTTATIMDFEEYSRLLLCDWQYRKKYPTDDKQPKLFDRSRRIVVYTSIYGDYDSLLDPEYTSEGIEYICFTNNRDIRSDVWSVFYEEFDYESNVMGAKKYKVFPNRYFSEYEVSVWVDGKFLIKSDLRDYIDKYNRTSTILCFPHYDRVCAYEEAAMCVHTGLGEKSLILAQIADYHNEGYPVDNGLYEMGCIVRWHNDPTVIRLMEEWDKQIKKYSYRDQISFPYVCWKTGIYPDISDEYIRRNPWLYEEEHKHFIR